MSCKTHSPLSSLLVDRVLMGMAVKRQIFLLVFIGLMVTLMPVSGDDHPAPVPNPGPIVAADPSSAPIAPSVSEAIADKPAASTPATSGAGADQAAATTTSAPSASTDQTETPTVSASVADNSQPVLKIASPQPINLSPSPGSAPNAIAAATAPTDPTTASTSSPTENVTINLIHLMVKRGLIDQKDAEGLIKQAQLEADTVRAQAATAQATAERALTVQQQSQSAAAPSAPSQAPEDEVRIAYVPDVVKQQMTQQIEQDVMAQTRNEEEANGGKQPDGLPDWVKRFRFSGDVRVRYEGDFYPSSNATGFFTNFNAINTNPNGLTFPGPAATNLNPPLVPQYNVDQNRERFRLRSRFGADVYLDDGFSSGIRIGTGSDNNPVSENQTFGGVNSFSQNQGGDFSKYAIWLDRAFIRYQLGSDPDQNLIVTIGRFDDPFMHTSMLWADDLGFDGAAIQGKYEVAKGVVPFMTAGAFPVYNTDLNFSSNQAVKFPSENKYLFALQGGSSVDITKQISFKGAAAIYDFENIQGQVSSPITNASLNAGNTDGSRPSFAQNGNTYIAIRDFEDPLATSENQFYGLASQFREFVLTGQFDFSNFDPFHISLVGEGVKNLAFNRNAIINGGPSPTGLSGEFAGPQNNTSSLDPNSFYGGDLGYLLKLNLGAAALQKLGDWNVSLSYRYVQSDAIVDGFTDSDFGAGLAGTNLQGYTVGGNVALNSHVWVGARWMSATSIAGPSYTSNLFQFDLNAKF
jgi:hypothetical protein